MRVPNRECNRVIEIDLRRAQGLDVVKNDVEFYQHHLKTCPDCGKEAAAFDAIGGEDNSGALPELDDLWRRRLIDEVIAKADEQRFDLETGIDTLPAVSERNGFYKYAWAASLAAACIVAVFVWKPWNPGTEPIESPVEIAKKVTAPVQQNLEGHFVLLAGEVSLQDHTAVLGDRLKSFDSINTKDGKAVVSLPTGIVVSLAEETQASFKFSDDSNYEVILEQGLIQVSVDPKQERPGFSVVTREGKVNVVGTIFSVGVQDEVEVRVLRGEVKLEESGGRQRRLRTSGATTLGTAKTWTLSKEERESLWKEARAVEILDVTGETAVNIGSTPGGASVIVDSVVLGRTPISASVKPGYREFAVALAGNKSARELVDIEAGSEVSREFNFVRNDSKPPKQNHVRAMESGTSGDSTPVTANGLLKSAQGLRSNRDWSGAARYYEQLVRDYPNSGEAKAGLISLCDIQLRKLGRTKESLKCFNKYLSKSVTGPLAQEAMFGKATALKKLGNVDAELKTLKNFLSLFPDAIQAEAVRQRISDAAIIQPH